MTSARELIEHGTCTAGCLAAVTDSTRCRCPCREQAIPLHGLLANADLTALIDARSIGLDRLSDLQVIGR